MTVPDYLGRSLSENLVTLLAHDDKHGKLIMQMTRPEQFEGDLKLIAERCVKYWREHGKAPKLHTMDLFSDIIEARGRQAPMIRRVLTQMQQLHEGINTEYVMKQLRTHRRLYAMKTAILEASEHIQSEQAERIAEAEDILVELLHAREVDFDPGVRLTDYQHVLRTLRDNDEEFDTGITVLDRRFVTPKRKTLYCMIGDKGSGKSWFLVGIGKRALLRHKKVLHITTENSMELTMQRYYQALFAVPKHHAEEVWIRIFELDRRGDFVGFGTDTIVPKWDLSAPDVGKRLKFNVGRHGARLNTLFIKEFPERYLTVNELRAYMDMLEDLEGFTPDMLIVDQPIKFKLDEKNYRISLGGVYSGIRGICMDRNIAGVCVHQGTRQGSTAKIMKAVHVAEDYSVTQTCDAIITLSKTELEKQQRLARIFVDKARDVEDTFGAVITQSYTTGQFVMDSVPLRRGYYDLRDALGGERETDHDESDIDDARFDP